jgi:KUP system potassium uptake protein
MTDAGADKAGTSGQAVQTGGHSQDIRLLVIGALGVVFGDIGTSPIYAFREALVASAGGQVASREDILGVLSLIIWALTIIVTIKYVMFVLRAHNRGEGGTLSLMALARRSLPKRSGIILALGMVGAALFYGDAVITPAISVLSAVEGMNVVTPAFQPYVVPLTLVILAVLFSVQRFGSGSVAIVFGPITLIWFVAIGYSGIVHIADDPEILLAVNPIYIVQFLANQPEVSFVTIGAIFLAVTGAEALYADLGHFGRRPIVLAWLCIVFPCLLLNYVGQGAYVLARGGVVGHPFFEMNEGWMLVPMVVLATAATVIASQAVITGAYSLTRQAVQLNMLPRLVIQHTSETTLGQIYMPRVNLLLALVVMLLVVGFGESSKLASAYGISVTGNMLVTTLLLSVVMLRIWRWPVAVVVFAIAVFGLIDIGFFASNIVKVFEGGWASLAVAFTIVLVM